MADIKAHPEFHKHTYEALKSCAFINGALDLMVIQAHEGLGPGPDCDVWSGPCSCGATHEGIRRQ